MQTQLDQLHLGTGETLTILRVDSPDDVLDADVQDLLGHKGGEWQEHMRAALSGDGTGALETRFYLGLIAGKPVANIMTVESHGVGWLGHVYTRPEHRRKGICKAVMARQMDDFRRRDGHVLVLGTGFESAAYWIYHSFGFRSLTGGFMRYSAEPVEQFAERWFAPQPAEVVPMEWRHAPLTAFLASLPGREFLRSAAWGVFGFGLLEWACTRFMTDVAKGEACGAAVLETANGAVAGCASVHHHRAGLDGRVWPGVWLVDVFTHAAYEDRIPDLVRCLPGRKGKLVTYVDTQAPWKAEALESCGFRREATLPAFLRVGGTERDVWMLGKEAG